MKIAIIGSRGWSYAGVEDMVREFCPKFVRDGHEVVVHGWATDEMTSKEDLHVNKEGAEYIYHRTSKGKFTPQLIIALKASIAAARSDCDVVIYLFIQNSIWSWIPRLAGKKVLSNVDGIMWKDPKWPVGFRHIFFPAGAYLTMLFGNRTITDSFHMQQLYKKRFLVNIGWVGYGCNTDIPETKPTELNERFPDGYYLIMSRITPHNSTRILVEGFIKSKTKRALVLAGHTPDNDYVNGIKELAKDCNVHFLGLIQDQEELTQIILNAKGYVHGHSLGGINPALVRVVGLNIPAMCVDTVYNREVVADLNAKEQAVLFPRDPEAVAGAVNKFELQEEEYKAEAVELGATVRDKMSWERIYQQYLALLTGISKKS